MKKIVKVIRVGIGYKANSNIERDVTTIMFVRYWKKTTYAYAVSSFDFVTVFIKSFVFLLRKFSPAHVHKGFI